METQWPLVIFTLFVCLTCGTLGGMSILALKGEGKNLQMTALITSAVSLVVGGIGAFLHLEHWERIFNGFGHITSGITQELIGCVALAIVIVVWFVMLRGEKPVPKALAWVTIVVAVLMVAATAHSYFMPARPAWGLALVAFYLGNACLLGAVAIWLISILKKDETAEATGIQLTFIAALVQLVADVVFVIACALSSFAQYGHYADPTSMTTAPTHIDSLLGIMVTGAGAPMFWGSIICVIVAAACALVAKKKVGASKTLMVVAAIVALATSVMFRVLIYQLGYPVVLLY
ncbi:dimethyl sulfoxide reductase anchor subunit family protein [Eggerthella timonensis]|uniref:dimethyl sulfoxide reductase anchor subunit family protein n=1 Tax=Eggerthella timonensis TaxID=1871008 RepID=UPI000C788C95|nr:DmsC/YnfH family molybdoenzyme membrane anchor subunit [Eggerthella timonensis]